MDLYLRANLTMREQPAPPASPIAFDSLVRLHLQMQETAFLWCFIDKPRAGTSAVVYHDQTRAPWPADGIRYASPGEQVTRTTHALGEGRVGELEVSVLSHGIYPPSDPNVPLPGNTPELTAARFRLRFRVVTPGIGNPNLYLVYWGRDEKAVQRAPPGWEREVIRRYPLPNVNEPPQYPLKSAVPGNMMAIQQQQQKMGMMQSPHQQPSQPFHPQHQQPFQQHQPPVPPQMPPQHSQQVQQHQQHQSPVRHHVAPPSGARAPQQQQQHQQPQGQQQPPTSQAPPQHINPLASQQHLRNSRPSSSAGPASGPGPTSGSQTGHPRAPPTSTVAQRGPAPPPPANSQMTAAQAHAQAQAQMQAQAQATQLRAQSSHFTFPAPFDDPFELLSDRSWAGLRYERNHALIAPIFDPSTTSELLLSWQPLSAVDLEKVKAQIAALEADVASLRSKSLSLSSAPLANSKSTSSTNGSNTAVPAGPANTNGNAYAALLAPLPGMLSIAEMKEGAMQAYNLKRQAIEQELAAKEEEERKRRQEVEEEERRAREEQEKAERVRKEEEEKKRREEEEREREEERKASLMKVKEKENQRLEFAEALPSPQQANGPDSNGFGDDYLMRDFLAPEDEQNGDGPGERELDLGEQVIPENDAENQDNREGKDDGMLQATFDAGQSKEDGQNTFDDSFLFSNDFGTNYNEDNMEQTMYELDFFNQNAFE